MIRYSIYPHAGLVPYDQWAAQGITVPIFDKDGTLTHANSPDMVPEVIDGLKQAQLPDIFPDIAVVSNNHNHAQVENFACLLRRALGVGVFAVSRAQGYASKPNSEMGHVVAREFGVTPKELGVIGDRLFADVRFGHKLGAGAVALCDKAGNGDAAGVAFLRLIEEVVTGMHILKGTAIDQHDRL